eukprot:6492161-Amphidinium_carterae.3
MPCARYLWGALHVPCQGDYASHNLPQLLTEHQRLPSALTRCQSPMTAQTHCRHLLRSPYARCPKALATELDTLICLHRD